MSDLRADADIEGLNSYESSASFVSRLMPLEGVVGDSAHAEGGAIKTTSDGGNALAPTSETDTDDYDLDEPKVPFKQQLKELWAKVKAWILRNPIATGILILVLCGVIVLAVFFLLGTFTPLLITILKDVRKLGPGVCLLLETCRFGFYSWRFFVYYSTPLTCACRVPSS